MAALRDIQAEWAASLVTGWDRWVALPSQVGDQLGQTLLGAAAGQVIVADSTTINLYKAVAAALALRPDRAAVVIEKGNFPTDRYIVEQLARGRVPSFADVWTRSTTTSPSSFSRPSTTARPRSLTSRG